MIAHISGVISEKFLSSVIIDVGGVGYEVQVPSLDYDSIVLGEEVKLYTYHHIREQSQDLYGFSSLAAKKLFEMLITVQGVGPKAGLAILSIGSTNDVQSAISRGDSTYVSGAAGVGKKTAERVVVDLSDKVGAPLTTRMHVSSSTAGDDALDALMALGYNFADAIKALDGIADDLPTSERVTQALKKV